MSGHTVAETVAQAHTQGELYVHVGEDYAEIREYKTLGSDTTHCTIHYPSKKQIAQLRNFAAAPKLLEALEEAQAALHQAHCLIKGDTPDETSMSWDDIKQQILEEIHSAHGACNLALAKAGAA